MAPFSRFAWRIDACMHHLRIHEYAYSMPPIPCIRSQDSLGNYWDCCLTLQAAQVGTGLAAIGANRAAMKSIMSSERVYKGPEAGGAQVTFVTRGELLKHSVFS